MKSAWMICLQRNFGSSITEKTPTTPRRLSCEQLEDRVVPAAGANESFVSQLYTELLHRPADSAGLQGWTALLNAGVSKNQVALDILSGDEYRSGLVNHLYQELLGRPAEPAAVAAWSEALRHESVQQFEAQLVGSQEFLDRAGGTNNAFLSALYQTLLHRSIDTTGTTVFGALLQSGQSRSDVALAILTSDEYRKDLVNHLYQELLHRDAETAGTDNWLQQLKMGMSEEGVIAGIVSSPEFLSSAPAAPAKPTITIPTSATTTLATNFNISGTAESGSLVQIRSSGGNVVGSKQLAPGETAFSISVPLTTNTANNFTVTATDASGNRSAAATVPTITQTTTGITVTSPGQQTNREGGTVNLHINATDLAGKTLTYAATGLPAGLTIGSTTGTITGTISAGASTSSPYTVKVTAADGTNSGNTTFTWVVNPPAPTITAPATQLNANGSTVSGVTVTATGSGSNPITYSATNLPPGLTINSTTGVISGTISQTGSNNSPYAVTVSATQNGQTGTAKFTWVVPTSATSTLPFSLTDPAWQTLPSGVRYLDQTVGTGAATSSGKTIKVDYIGYLTNGTIFDQGNGFSSQLDVAHLIKGWVDAVPGMKVGGVRLLDIPSSLAYGSSSPSASIPPNSELVFKITLNSTT